MGWILGFCAMATLGLPGLAGFWGEFPAILSAFQPGARPLASRCSASTWWSPRSAPCSPPATCSGCSRRSRSACRSPSSRDAHIHDVHAFEWIAWIADPAAHRRARRLPEHHLPRHRRRGHPHDRRIANVIGSRDVSPRRDAVATRSSTGTRSRPRSSSSATIVVVLRRRPALARPRSRFAVVAHRVDRRARRADPGRSRSRPTATTASMFGGAFVVDHYALAFKGFFLVVDLHHDPALGRLHRRGRLLPGRVLLPAAHVGARHDHDGVGARPHHAVRRARDDLDPHVRPRRVAQARPRSRTKRASSTT